MPVPISQSEGLANDPWRLVSTKSAPAGLRTCDGRALCYTYSPSASVRRLNYGAERSPARRRVHPPATVTHTKRPAGASRHPKRPSPESLSFYADAGLIGCVRERARQDDRTVSAVIRVALRHYLSAASATGGEVAR